MRSPAEIWSRDHQKAYEAVDTLVSLLAPDDIQARLMKPEENILRAELASKLHFLVDFADKHFKDEEELLIPALKQHLDINSSEIKDALGCLSREHDQMHAFAERIRVAMPEFEGPEPPDASSIAEILRISYAIQSIVRHHCTKEEREIFPLIEKLPAKVVFEIVNKLAADDPLSIDHLVKPLGPKPDDIEDLRGIDSPEN